MGDDLGDPLKNRTGNLAEVFRIDLLDDIVVSTDIGEKDRHLFSFTFQGEPIRNAFRPEGDAALVTEMTARAISIAAGRT
ncbi:hypothetical protein JCM12296A_00840 [Desulfosarcina cetonica]